MKIFWTAHRNRRSWSGHLQIRVSIKPEDAYFQTGVWTSSNEEIAEVNENGVVEGHKPGTVTISFTSDDPTATRKTQIQVKVNQAVEDYILWQQSKIGRDINPDMLVSKIKDAGAKRCVVTYPVYTVVPDSSIARLGSKTVTYGGIEND